MWKEKERKEIIVLIRSQDNNRIANFNQVERVYIYEGDKKLYYISFDGIDMGIYKTKDIAIKVLDKICSCYEQEEYTDNIWNGNATIPMIYKTNMIYNMPKEEEVR
jgi:hypothetical protein